MKLNSKQRKIYRVRNNLKKVSKEGRYRLSVSRSSKNISAQIIDDIKGSTRLQVSTLSEKKSLTVTDSKELGIILAKKALEKNISLVWFDRGYFKYHGRVKAFADGAREGGLKF